MIDSLYNLFFGCRHRRRSFPLRPVTKRGAPQGDMYVVCLDCGKRFHYDWERMRVGDPIEIQAVHKSRKLRGLAAASALPVIWLIGKAAFSRKHSKSGKEEGSEPKS